MATHYLGMDEEEHFEFEMFGISSRERDFRLAWSLNVTLGWELERGDDLETQQRLGNSYHTRFVYQDPEDQTTFILLANRSEEGMMLPEWSQFDYLLKVKDAPVFSGEDLCRVLRKVPMVLAAFPLSLEKLKSKYNLINA